jgi:acetyltransferase
MIEPAEQWLSPEGIAVTIRPIRASDLELERAFVNQLTPATAYQRLFSPRSLTEAELRRFTNIDYERDMAVIATISQSGSERQIGVARYIREPHTRNAEFAIVLSDDWQGRGLGSVLLRSLMDAARTSGIACLEGAVLSENAPMIALAKKSGFAVHRDPRGAQVTILTIRLDELEP